MKDFDQIFEYYWSKVYRLCMGYVNDEAWAKDIAQEVFITVWQQLPKFRQEAAIGTWVFRIAVNHCLRQLKQVKRNSFIRELHDLPESETNYDDPRINLLYRSIVSLPELDRIIISLELEDIDQDEIAAITGLSHANIRTRIHRIKKKLFKKMSHHE